MPKVAHTPGPWRVEEYDDGSSAVAPHEGFAVCTMAVVPPERIAANARLIAAAPDLLAALTQLRDLRNQWRNDDRYSSIDYMDAIDALPWEAAIAAAEGGGE